jgi:hypothetical protein
MNSNQYPDDNLRRQFFHKLLADFKSGFAALTPNIPYATGTSVLLTMGGIEPGWAIFFGLVVGWLNKPPKE